MGPWGFVGLAYGIVWTAIVLYLLSLKSRMRKAQARLSQSRSKEGADKNAA
ncbi:MAG TPA: CcmD family protein [Candidatus Binatia bacterium]|jgi:CcmD family protein